MFNIKVADIAIGIENKYDYIKTMCKEYLCESEELVNISVTDAEIDAEDTEGGLDKGYLESLAIYRKIAEKILEYNGFLMHGVVLDAQGTGVAFLARSGVGKSTHLNLWQQVLNEKITVINGDKPLIRIIDGEIFAYGTPWAGKERLQKNTKIKLSKICFIERNEENECVELSKDEILERILPQIYKPKNVAKLLVSMDLIEQMEKCEFYLVRCNMEISAAKIAIERVLESEMEKELRKNGIYITKTKGDSMSPMLTEGDRVIITPVKKPLRRGDIPVYRRGDHYTMHRIVRVKKTGYLICGDNRTYIEKDIKNEDIVGVLQAFYHNGKYIERDSKIYRRYERKALFLLPFKILIEKIKRVFC